MSDRSPEGFRKVFVGEKPTPAKRLYGDKVARRAREMQRFCDEYGKARNV